ncbi:hypothetical protein [Oxynema aestuarii]|uniref:Uncharacterized protein n=1 Tax=Oxynema aestuarii AP17 TaxID=2064643 RepID=A0A6H1U0M3_9CYAN|nr:hypothetical protein [Oxynema aestuarii]QIZ71710.1 hypothetical protein HCG48_14900 [Oxynema aestuarii AP17]
MSVAGDLQWRRIQIKNYPVGTRSTEVSVLRIDPAIALTEIVDLEMASFGRSVYSLPI